MRVLKYFFVFVCLFFITSCNKTIQKEKIEFYKVTPSQKTVYTGTVKFQHSSDLSFQQDGVITYIPFTKGDFVKKGQIVAKIDDTLYKIRQQEEMAALSKLDIEQKQSRSYYNRMDILHKAGGVSDNDWEEARYSTSIKSREIALQKEKINYINKQLSYTILTSPFDGYVFEKQAEVGEYVTASKPVLIITNSTKTQVEIMVSSDIVNNLNLNENVVLNRGDIFYSGKITHISQSSSNSGGYLIKILLNKFYPDLKEGMNLDVEIPKLNKNKIYIPLNAVFEEDGKPFVFKIENIKDNKGTIKKTKILTGNIINGDIEAVYGLKTGDLIILKGQNDVKDNSTIEL